MRHEVATRRVLYKIAGMESVRVRKEKFRGANGEALPLEIYEAIAPVANPAPVVVIVEGFPDSGFEQHLGCKFMEMEWTISMAQLIAEAVGHGVINCDRIVCGRPGGSGLEVGHSAREGCGYRQAAGVGVVLHIWTASGHAPVALAAAKKATCAVLTNPMTRDFCPDTPLFIVRSGKDETPGLNAALDAFAARAVAENRPITLVNYPGAPHSFELSVDASETRRILHQGLDFLRAHLG